ncbi:uncharacterized protein [Physcomitrium patens]|uniref:Uncharacterized protein n=1 Tax=Physcomitrium patens TaxID=3218 RepID=A0A2K1L901_PHYPA|nr:uncharacterized protein LOC112291049 isoform X2 [Physcomitrium patens]PNR62481.1 hypothetical protein PHYPA_000905 [Physcomitrium patens]|eukprot:XP_024393771.1 uncharacterized protein LOC112291049 isoform X2 [Physcomitrella patens]
MGSVRHGARSIEEPNTPRPGGVPQGSVLVVLDVTKGITTAPVYWALGNVVRRGDNFKIVGILTHLCNPMGFRTRVDKNSWIGSNGLMLQHELTLKRNSLEEIPHVREWCEKAGVNLELDVKAGYTTRTIIVDEAKAIGAYHVVLDKTMKSDKKYFIEHLKCFVSRSRQSGGVETIRSFSVTKQLPPLVPIPPNSSRSVIQPTPSSGSIVSMGSQFSSSSHARGSMGSSASYDIASTDGFLTQDSDQLTGAPSTGESIERHQETYEVPEHRSSIQLRALYGDVGMHKGSHQIVGIPRVSPAETETGYNMVNRKPALRKWLAEDEPAAAVPSHENSNPESFNDRSNESKIPAVLTHDQFRRSPNHSGPLDKNANPAPLSPAPARSFQSTAGRTFAPANAPVRTSLPSPPFSRMPSPPNHNPSQGWQKSVWIWTRSKEVMRTAVEVGWTTFVFTPDVQHVAPQWASIEWIKPLFLEGGQFLSEDGKQVALLGQVYSGEQLDYLPAMMGGAETVVINDLDWQVIPPEDVVAAFQGRRTNLFATANTAADAQVYLEALEVGTDGVVLHTDSCSEITALRDYLAAKKIEKDRAVEGTPVELPVKEMSELKLKPEPTLVARTETNTLNTVGSSPSLNINPLNRVGSSPRSAESPSCSVQNLSATPAPQGLRLVNATVKSVTSVGEGDRVSVDLCNLLNPGEALLVGSFSKGMFLVHSEVQFNNTSRRSFRVNAGPVHAYTGMARGHITYLSELESGGQVLAVDANGNFRTVLVGRVSIESKPLVLVVVEADGEQFSVMLQDADSVRLVVPAEMQRPGSEAVAVTKLQPGDTVLLSIEDSDCSYEQ